MEFPIPITTNNKTEKAEYTLMVSFIQPLSTNLTKNVLLSTCHLFYCPLQITIGSSNLLNILLYCIQLKNE